MTIAEMHVWFRQYAQQMGMQNVRAILPEQIDLVINSSITDTVNQIITQNIGVTNDRIITDNSKIGQINALRSLYKVRVLDDIDENFAQGGETHIRRLFSPIDLFDENNGNVYKLVSSGTVETSSKAALIAALSSNEKLNIHYVSTDAEFADFADASYNDHYIVKRGSNAFKYLYLVDLSINYKKGETAKTNYFPVRLIDDAYLADTLNDFVLRPRLRTPIAVLYNSQLDLYIDILEGTSGSEHLPQNLTPNQLRISYIAKPAEVKYQSDIGGTDIDCDLPEYMHVDILKHAVDLYRIAVQGGMYAAQQQQQAQNQEIARNNARPDNEGY